MNTAEIVFAALAAVSPIVAVIVAIISTRRNKDKAIEDDAKELGQMQSDLGYIKSGIDDLKTSQLRHDEKLDVLSERVAKLESSLEAHIRDRNAHGYAKPKRTGANN